jgi:hypothetical protein
MGWGKVVRCLLVLATLVVGSQGFAQTRYTCKLSDGRSYASDRPCATDGLVYYGPQTERSTQSSYQSSHQSSYGSRSNEAPACLKYMSARCSSMHDAIRTSSARGVRAETVAEARKNYQEECAADESQASSRLSKERGEKYQAKEEARHAEELNQQQSATKDQQCGESKRILMLKRARMDLTEGEKGDLKRFEDNYKARCGG